MENTRKLNKYGKKRKLEKKTLNGFTKEIENKEPHNFFS